MARATAVLRPRSGPNQGCARAPLTGLRVVATSSVGRATMSEASNRGPVAAKPAQPPTASAVAVDARPRSAIRRETAMRSSSMRQSFSRDGTRGVRPRAPFRVVWPLIAAITGQTRWIKSPAKTWRFCVGVGGDFVHAFTPRTGGCAERPNRVGNAPSKLGGLAKPRQGRVAHLTCIRCIAHMSVM